MKSLIISTLAIVLLASCSFSSDFKIKPMNSDGSKAALHGPSVQHYSYEWVKLTENDDPEDYIFPIDWQDE